MAREYFVYRGDEFLVVGTAEECANYLGIKKSSLLWLSSTVAKKRKMKLYVEKLEVDEICK